MGGIAHTSGTLKFRIISKVNQSPTQASFGVRNISITVSQRDPTDMCYRSDDSIATGASGECPCAIHWYPKGLSPLECEACDPSCLDCFDSNPDECTQCLPGYSYTSSKKCEKCASSCATCTGTSSNQCTTCAPGYWLQPDGTCTASCPLPSGYSQQVGDFKVCQTACSAGQYMYANGSCGGSCPAPYIGQTINSNLICKLCANDNDFYYQWNGTCGATCPEPLVINGGQICQLPCNINDFYYPNNGSCDSACSSPFVGSVVLGAVKQCDSPCGINEYLLWNRTCSSSCPVPYVGEIMNNNNLICKLCANDNEFFYEWNETCGATCAEPLVMNGQLCQLPCAVDEFYFSNNDTCGSICGNPFVASVAFDVVKQCESPCEINQYLLWNGTCSSFCPAPHFGQSINNNLFCKLCQNDDDFYYDWNNTCGSDCTSPLIMNGQLCQLPCDIDDFYYLSNDTCDPTCNSPLVNSVIFDGLKQCESPCDSNEYLLWNGSCVGGCPAPYYERIFGGGFKLCDACEPGYFMFPNGTCLPQCDPPLQQETMNGSYFCSFPCAGAAQYLLKNGTCIENCQLPMQLITESIGNFCESPCQGNDFLYVGNSSCLGECNSPWKSQSINGINLCLSPCADGEFLDEVSSSCLSECNAPFIPQIKESILMCINPIQQDPTTTTEVASSTSSSSSSELNEDFVESTNDITDTTGKLTSVGTFITTLLSSSTPSGITLPVLVKMLKYIRYMEVNYPPLLELMLEDQAKSPISLDIGFNMPQGLQKKFARKPLPLKFEKYQVPSNFIVNCWQELLTMGLVILVMLSAILIARLTSKHKHISSFFKRVSKATRWNFFLLIVCSNLIEIGLFSCLQMRSISFVSFGEGFGLILSLFMSSFALFVLIQAFYIPRTLGRNGRKWENWSILFKEFKSHNFFQQSYMFFFLLRIVIFDILLGCFYSYPILQAVLLSIMSFAMICYISICRPFKEKFYLIKSLIEEGIVTFVNICVLILAIMDKLDYENEATRVWLGDVVILINFAFNIIALAFALIEISIRVYGIYQLVKMDKSRGLKFWKKVILVLIEPESLEGPRKLHAKNIGSTRKVHPYINPPNSLGLLNSNQAAKKLSHNLSISENLDFTGSLVENTSRNVVGSRYNSRNLLLNSLSPSNNSDDAEAGNAEFKESTPTNEEANVNLAFKSNSISRLHPRRRTLVNRHYSPKSNFDENAIIR